MKENKEIFPSAERGIHLPEITDGDKIQQEAQTAFYQVEDKSAINSPLIQVAICFVNQVGHMLFQEFEKSVSFRLDKISTL